ncbi:MAG: TspO/MBR family protein, partial [Patescibacteria group bacterium]
IFFEKCSKVGQQGEPDRIQIGIAPFRGFFVSGFFPPEFKKELKSQNDCGNFEIIKKLLTTFPCDKRYNGIMKVNNFFKLAIAIVVSELAGVIGLFFTISEIPTWYAGLVKPALNPPAWAFGPTWTTLYALMGIAAFLIWRMGWERKEVKIALRVFGMQLFLNIIWSVIFFGLHSPGGALIEIVFLWLAILATIIAFYKISRLASWILVPYILWVSFAMYLNYVIWTLN